MPVSGVVGDSLIHLTVENISECAAKEHLIQIYLISIVTYPPWYLTPHLTFLLPHSYPEVRVILSCAKHNVKISVAIAWTCVVI